MSEETVYFMDMSVPVPTGDSQHTWIKMNTLRAPSITGYLTGEELMKQQEQMARELTEGINLAANIQNERLTIKPVENPPHQTQEASNTTHYETGQSSLDGQQSTNTSETRGGSGNREMYPPSEAQTQYLDLLRMKGTKHHDRTVSFLSEHNKISIGELDKRQTSDLISILKDIKE